MLSYELRTHGFYDELKTLSESGVLYGGSAGAIVCGDLLGTSPDSREGYEQEHEGMNVLGGWSVWPHYSPCKDDVVEAFVKNHNAKLIAIPEESGVIVDGTRFETVGTKPVYIFRDQMSVRKQRIDKTSFIR
mgnify:CR=1 FL=1